MFVEWPQATMLYILRHKMTVFPVNDGERTRYVGFVLTPRSSTDGPLRVKFDPARRPTTIVDQYSLDFGVVSSCLAHLAVISSTRHMQYSSKS